MKLRIGNDKVQLDIFEDVYELHFYTVHAGYNLVILSESELQEIYKVLDEYRRMKNENR